MILGQIISYRAKMCRPALKRRLENKHRKIPAQCVRLGLGWAISLIWHASRQLSFQINCSAIPQKRAWI